MFGSFAGRLELQKASSLELEELVLALEQPQQVHPLGESPRERPDDVFEKRLAGFVDRPEVGPAERRRDVCEESEAMLVALCRTLVEETGDAGLHERPPRVPAVVEDGDGVRTLPEDLTQVLVDGVGRVPAVDEDDQLARAVVGNRQRHRRGQLGR